MTDTKKRMLTVVAALFLCASVLCSCLFIAYHADHDCTYDDDCAVCRIIDACVNILRGAVSGSGGAAAVSAAVIILAAAAVSAPATAAVRTLISLKVELRN